MIFLYQVEENNIPEDKIEITQQITVTDEVDWDLVIVGGTIFILLAVLAILLPSRIITSVSLSGDSKENKTNYHKIRR